MIVPTHNNIFEFYRLTVTNVATKIVTFKENL